MKREGIVILGIESSCDETSAAICRDGNILSNVIASQDVHVQYGGVVPELASRAHMQNIVPVVDQAMKLANTDLKDLDAIAFTQSPGLIGALLVGTSFAKSLALSLDLPLIGVHHMQAHVLSNMIEEPQPSFPFLCLTVSGGHTQIVLCSDAFKMEILGETIDDAAGEAFDKSAKLLGLPYPGGPLIDQYASKGDPTRFQFSEPQIDGLNFSFSGVKTSILYFCASIQHSIIQILMHKLKKASLETGIKNICMAGGVSANKGLRNAMYQYAEKYHWNIHIPSFEYCTDNAAMIAITGYYKFIKGEASTLNVSANARATWD
jgi:N6-L-threonylcarbamoyladenine synthase